MVDTTKGIGKTVVGGAAVAGEEVKEPGQAAKPKAKNAWEDVRDGSVSFGRSVKTFFTRFFSDSPKRGDVKDGSAPTKAGDSTQQ